eukprot:gene9532-10401_t
MDLLASTSPPKVESQPLSVSEMTPYQLAQRGLVKPLEDLIDKGFNVDTPDEEGITCLHWCSINNRVDCIRGAAVDPIGGELRATPLHWALRHGHLDVIVILVNHGASVSVIDSQGFSPVHIAAQFGHMHVAAYLIARGANVNIADENGRTPLIWAASKSFTSELVRCLIALDASVNLQDHGGNTALHYAVATNNLFAVHALIDAGASKDIKNSQGASPYDIAWKSSPVQDEEHGHSHSTINPQLRSLILRLQFPDENQQRIDKALSFWRTDPIRRIGVLCCPLFGLSAVGFAFQQMTFNLLWGTLYLAFSFWMWVIFVRLFDHGFKHGSSPTPMAVYIGTKILLAATLLTLFWPAEFDDGPLLPPLFKAFCIAVTVVLSYNFYK